MIRNGFALRLLSLFEQNIIPRYFAITVYTMVSEMITPEMHVVTMAIWEGETTQFSQRTSSQ